MPLASMHKTLAQVLADRYGVPAFNLANDPTIEAVTTAPDEERSPVILQTSVKKVNTHSRTQFFDIFTAVSRHSDVPVTLRVDHCPEWGVNSDCLAVEWNFVPLNAHELDVAMNFTETAEGVGGPRRYGALVEGQIEGIQGVEDGVGRDHVTLETFSRCISASVTA